MATASEIASQSSVGFGESLFEAMQVTILRNILTGLGVTMTTQEINTAAACFICLGMSLPQAQALVLLNAISENVSGGGGGAQEVYTGAAPPAAPDNPALPALYYPTGGGTLFQWDGAAWV